MEDHLEDHLPKGILYSEGPPGYPLLKMEDLRAFLDITRTGVYYNIFKNG